MIDLWVLYGCCDFVVLVVTGDYGCGWLGGCGVDAA